MAQAQQIELALANHERVRKSTDLPLFNGDKTKDTIDPHDFLTRFETASRIANWVPVPAAGQPPNTARKCQEFCILLRHNAAEWLKSLELLEGFNMDSWDDLKRGFIITWAPKYTARTACLSFTDLSQQAGEGVALFYLRVTKAYRLLKDTRPQALLLVRTPPPAVDADNEAARLIAAEEYGTRVKLEGLEDMGRYMIQAMFTAGLNDDLRIKTMEAQLNTHHEAYQHALRAETIIKDKRGSKPMISAVQQASADSEADIESEEEELLDQVNAIRFSRGKKAIRFAPKGNRGKVTISCRYCKKKGHFQRDCQKRKKENGKMVDAQGKPYKVTSLEDEDEEEEEQEPQSESETEQAIHSISQQFYGINAITAEEENDDKVYSIKDSTFLNFDTVPLATVTACEPPTLGHRKPAFSATALECVDQQSVKDKDMTIKSNPFSLDSRKFFTKAFIEEMECETHHPHLEIAINSALKPFEYPKDYNSSIMFEHRPLIKEMSTMAKSRCSCIFNFKLISRQHYLHQTPQALDFLERHGITDFKDDTPRSSLTVSSPTMRCICKAGREPKLCYCIEEFRYLKGTNSYAVEEQAKYFIMKHKLKDLYDDEQYLVCTCEQDDEFNITRFEKNLLIPHYDSKLCDCLFSLQHRGAYAEFYGPQSNSCFAFFHDIENVRGSHLGAKCICGQDLRQMERDMKRHEKRHQWIREVDGQDVKPITPPPKNRNHLAWFEQEENLLASLFNEEREDNKDKENDELYSDDDLSHYVETDDEYRQWMQNMGGNLLSSLIFQDNDEEKDDPPSLN
jgi:Retrotransposon gag protein